MPSLGADMRSGRVVEWFVHPGDEIRRGDVVGVVDTSKGAIEMETWEDGVVEEMVVGPGDDVPVGEVLFRFNPAAGEEEAERPEEPAARTETEEEAPAGEAAPPAEEVAVLSEERGSAAEKATRASPAARKRARQLGFDLSQIDGSGPAGAVVLADVEARAGNPPTRRWPEGEVHATPLARKAAEIHDVDLGRLSGTGPGGLITRHDVEGLAGVVEGPSEAEEAVDRLEAMRSAMAAAMARSKSEIPHFYLGTTVSALRMKEWLADENAERSPRERILPVAVLLKAVAVAVREFPELNGFWREGDFVPADSVHTGLAISLRGGGLVAPAIHDVDRRTLDEITGAVTDLVGRARVGRLRSSE
ncbi:MAG: E3 binding domain-containing protein, partial [Gemmatimonadota bacterium]